MNDEKNARAQARTLFLEILRAQPGLLIGASFSLKGEALATYANDFIEAYSVMLQKHE